MSPRTRVVGYLRVSTEQQAEDGSSLDAQRERVTAYAQLYGLDLVQIATDAGVSAKTLEREGMQRALAMLRGGEADGILVAKLDRLTRSVRDLGELVERYFASGRFVLLSVGEQIDTRGAGGKLVLNVLASVSQWEREIIAERTAETMRAMSARGEFVGGTPPYGFAVGAAGHLVPDSSEQAVIARARELHGQGLSFRRIGQVLADSSSLSRRGKPFLPAQVARMLATVHGPSAEHPAPSDPGRP